MRLTVLIALAVFGSGPLVAGYAQTLRFSPVEKSIVLERAADAPATMEGRQAKIKELFGLAGCKGEALAEQGTGELALPEIVCRLPGQGGETIVVEANYGEAPFDNWNGVSLLPGLYQSLAGRKRRHTFLFVAWPGQKNPLAGSKFFAGRLSPAEAGHIAALVNLEALGFSPTKIGERLSDKDLVRALMKVVYSLKLSASQVDIPEPVLLDSASFAPAKIPQITIHSLTQEDAALLGADRGIPSQQFQPDNFYDSYHLISGYLAYLDQTLRRKPHGDRER